MWTIGLRRDIKGIPFGGVELYPRGDNPISNGTLSRRRVEI